MTSSLHRWRIWLRAFLLVALLPAFTVGCLTAEALQQGDVLATPLRPVSPEATLVGMTLHVSPATITLMESGKGLATVALDSSTQLGSVDGYQVSIGSLKRGMMIQAAGQMVGGRLVAREVRILEASQP